MHPAAKHQIIFILLCCTVCETVLISALCATVLSSASYTRGTVASSRINYRPIPLVKLGQFRRHQRRRLVVVRIIVAAVHTLSHTQRSPSREHKRNLRSSAHRPVRQTSVRRTWTCKGRTARPSFARNLRPPSVLRPYAARLSVRRTSEPRTRRKRNLFFLKKNFISTSVRHPSECLKYVRLSSRCFRTHIARV